MDVFLQEHINACQLIKEKLVSRELTTQQAAQQLLDLGLVFTDRLKKELEKQEGRRFELARQFIQDYMPNVDFSDFEVRKIQKVLEAALNK